MAVLRNGAGQRPEWQFMGKCSDAYKGRKLRTQPPRPPFPSGSFNPITQGKLPPRYIYLPMSEQPHLPSPPLPPAHLNAAAEILHTHLVDEVWIVPCGEARHSLENIGLALTLSLTLTLTLSTPLILTLT